MSEIEQQLKANIFDFIELINKNRELPIGKSTKIIYRNSIFRIYNNFFKDILKKEISNEFQPEIFINFQPKILLYIKNNDKFSLEIKRGFISTIIFIINGLSRKEIIYTTYLNELNKYKKEIFDVKKTQKKTVSESNNWVEQSEVIDAYNKYKNLYSNLLDKKILNENEYNNLQNYIIISLFRLNSPRRLNDYITMKYFNFDKEKDNYVDLKRKQFVFNDYKTNKFFKQNKVEINDELLDILTKFIKIKKSKKNKFNKELLLENQNSEMIKQSSLAIRFKTIFNTDKNISTTLLRKIFVSNFYKDDIKNKDIEILENDMAHSNKTQKLFYTKY